MENENRLNYLKHCYKEMFGDQDETNKKWIKNICLENSYNYLMERARKAVTESEFKYFTTMLNQYVLLWKGQMINHVMTLYHNDKTGLSVWLEFDTFFMDTFPDTSGSISAFDIGWAFREHKFDVMGKTYTLESYFDAIGYDYTFVLE